jgi:glycosyltransferase involved in cell wall biosynthesis
MEVSVILSTYNSPAWLEKSIWGYAKQTHRGFELLVADDGSDEETARCIHRLKRETGLLIRHFWQEHRGFRKCTILNRAIAAALTDYLVFSDGDCIPREDFLATHVRLARRGCMLSGGAVRLPLHLSHSITREDILSGRVCDPKWLASRGVGWNKRGRILVRTAAVAWLLDALTTTRATMNGCNSSAWKTDVLRVNGFDERMLYGGLDRELGERLANAGVRGKQIRHRAICLHLDHARAYDVPEARKFNRQIRKETRRHRFTWTPYGIKKGLRVFGREEPVQRELEEAVPPQAAA